MTEDVPPQPVHMRIAGKYADARDHTPSMIQKYAIKGWLLRGHTSVVYGPSNCGKSALVCLLGNAVATGAEVFGARTEKGIVVHVAAESPGSILDRTAAYDFSSAEVAPYYVLQSAVDLTDGHAVSEFIEELQCLASMHELPIVLVVFDTFARSIGTADENASGEMTRAVQHAERIARTIDTHCVLIHHSGKDPGRGGRGSSSIQAAVDTEIRLVPKENGLVHVISDKQRDDKKGVTAAFRVEAVQLGVDQDGDPRTVAKAVECNPNDNGSPNAGKDKPSDRHSAVRTTLTLISSGVIPFRPTFGAPDILKLLPPNLVPGPTEEARRKSIARALSALAGEVDPLVEREGKEWKITGAPSFSFPASQPDNAGVSWPA